MYSFVESMHLYRGNVAYVLLDEIFFNQLVWYKYDRCETRLCMQANLWPCT